MAVESLSVSGVLDFRREKRIEQNALRERCLHGFLSEAAHALDVSNTRTKAAPANQGVSAGSCSRARPYASEASAADESRRVRVAPEVSKCDGSAAQRWTAQGFGGTNRWQFANEASHLCFDTFDGAFNGARLLQNQCAPISNDQFKSSRSLPDVVTLMARVGFRDTGFCIDVPGNAGTRRLAVQLFQCNNTDAQKWLVGFA
ncbi:RICIN domain-containing protein [Amycolatopsis sp. NPDC098790]|uniref:RICIN domain-containing protein n=1 Tax=Amycolatopsis sp. NPDC098790 TaxID=3363939 RepID=UPI003827EB74